MSLTATTSASQWTELTRPQRAGGPGSGHGWALERQLSRIAARQHGVVAAWQLLELGFARPAILVRVRQGRLHRVHAGVYAVGHAAITRHGEWLAAVLATGREAVLSHRSAASLWDLGELGARDVEVTLPGLGGRARPRVRVHRTRRLPSAERTSVVGIPVTSVERLLVDLAGTIAPRHVRNIYIEAQRRGVVDPGLLERVIKGSRGRRGVRIARRMLVDYTGEYARTRSPLEVDFLDFCRRHGLPEPLVNVWIGGYLVDAHWPDANLVVELDSWRYHGDRESFERDRARIGDLSLHGIRVIPMTHRQLANEGTRAATVIRNALSARRTERGGFCG